MLEVSKLLRTANYAHSSFHSEEHSFSQSHTEAATEVDEKMYFPIFVEKHILKSFLINCRPSGLQLY